MCESRVARGESQRAADPPTRKGSRTNCRERLLQDCNPSQNPFCACLVGDLCRTNVITITISIRNPAYNFRVKQPVTPCGIHAKEHREDEEPLPEDYSTYNCNVNDLRICVHCSNLYWNQNWPTPPASRDSRSAAKTRSGVPLDRGVLVCGRESLQMASGILDSSSISGCALGHAPS